jgi:hypothetical protein
VFINAIYVTFTKKHGLVAEVIGGKPIDWSNTFAVPRRD